jgi:hypothetical protein
MRKASAVEFFIAGRTVKFPQHFEKCLAVANLSSVCFLRRQWRWPGIFGERINISAVFDFKKSQ